MAQLREHSILDGDEVVFPYRRCFPLVLSEWTGKKRQEARTGISFADKCATVRIAIVSLTIAFALAVPWIRPAAGQSARPDLSSSQARYVCPMHADIRSGTAGICPICRMPLIPRSA